MDWGSIIANVIDVQGFAPRWLSLLVDATLKTTMILLVAGVVTFAMRAASAAARHAVWTIAFGGILVLPLLSTLLPSVEVGFLPRVELPGPATAPGTSQPPPAPTPGAGVQSRPDAALPEASPASTAPRPSPASDPGPTLIPSSPLSAGSDVDLEHSNQRSVVTGARWRSSGVLVGLWLTGTTLVLTWLIVGLVRVDRVGRRSIREQDPEWRNLAATLRAALGISRDVDLLVSPVVSMPMTWGIVKPVVLLPETASTWSAQRKHDVLLHEMAHVQRYDFLTQLIARYACAMFWFNPIVWLAARQLRVEREQACDDVVLHAGSRPSTYAAHLLEIARQMKASPSTGFATVAMARRSQLAGRLLAVLDDGRRRGPLPGFASVAAWMIGLIVFIPLASLHPANATASPLEGPGMVPAATPVAFVPIERPVPMSAPLAPRPTAELLPPSEFDGPQERQSVAWASAPDCRELQSQGRRGTSENVNNDRRTTRFWDGDCEGEISIRGDVGFDRDFTDVTTLSRPGRFTIQIDDGRQTRRIELRSENGISRRWFVDGNEQQYGADAQAWFAAALVDFFRHSSLYVDERVERILQQSGVQGLLREAEIVHSQHVMRRMYAKAIESGQLSPQEIGRVLASASAAITSDFELAQLLAAVPGPALRDESLRQTYVQASNTIESDFEKRRVLAAMLKQDNLQDGTVRMLLESARDIESDFELASLLIEVGPKYLTNDAVRTLFLQAAGTIDSDFERGRVLAALLEQQGLSSAVLLAVLQSSENIQSDFELAKLLVSVADRYVIDQTLRRAFFDAVRTIESDHEKQRVLKAVMQNPRFDKSMLSDVIDAAQSINSDFALSGVLIDVVNGYAIDGTVRESYFRALSTLESDFERQRALTALMEQRELPREVVLDAITATIGIQSDHSKSVALIAIAEKYRENETVRDALMDAAESIGSSYEYGRVVGAIRGRTRS